MSLHGSADDIPRFPRHPLHFGQEITDPAILDRRYGVVIERPLDFGNGFAEPLGNGEECFEDIGRRRCRPSDFVDSLQSARAKEKFPYPPIAGDGKKFSDEVWGKSGEATEPVIIC